MNGGDRVELRAAIGGNDHPLVPIEFGMLHDREVPAKKAVLEAKRISRRENPQASSEEFVIEDEILAADAPPSVVHRVSRQLGEFIDFSGIDPGAALFQSRWPKFCPILERCLLRLGCGDSNAKLSSHGG
jgi:hypothetical protein